MFSKAFLAFALSLPLSVTALKASFTEYGEGDSMGSPNCATAVNACGEPGGGFTAALSQAQFGAGPGEGAGPACGTCYKLTVTTDLSGQPVTENSVTGFGGNGWVLYEQPGWDRDGGAGELLSGARKGN
ncbi:hypothetical protein V492_05359 [Pseudogymnoascus sp. VKM F-4246]|nr:hypothetical protein V492_05359 [Pseudogymnoascus sp. VKM F-4246]